MKRTIILFFAGLLLFFNNNVYAQSEINKEAIVEVAQKWLVAADKGHYSKCWKNTSEFFQDAVSKDKFVQIMKSVRGSLGEMVERRMISSEYATSLPGAPDGEYVVILFETEFEKKKVAIETITPMKDEDGIWRVSGYYIR